MDPEQRRANNCNKNPITNKDTKDIIYTAASEQPTGANKKSSQQFMATTNLEEKIKEKPKYMI